MKPTKMDELQSRVGDALGWGVAGCIVADAAARMRRLVQHLKAWEKKHGTLRNYENDVMLQADWHIFDFQLRRLRESFIDVKNSKRMVKYNVLYDQDKCWNFFAEALAMTGNRTPYVADKVLGRAMLRAFNLAMEGDVTTRLEVTQTAVLVIGSVMDTLLLAMDDLIPELATTESVQKFLSKFALECKRMNTALEGISGAFDAWFKNFEWVYFKEDNMPPAADETQADGQSPIIL